ncbi:aldo/keto reductase [bacterium]|nr:aldo/keto reductase [bacterium]
MSEINKTGNMQYRTLGKTGISVSEVSFGSHLKKFNVENPEHRRKQIEIGIEKGINLFDIYEHSYKQFDPMSKALDYVRNEVVISLVTVWRAVDEVMDEVESSLRVFKRDYIDLYRVVLGGNWDDSEQRLATLMKAKEQGKIRAVGGVVHYPEHLIEALKRYPELGYIMVPACFYAPRLIQDEKLISAIRKSDVGVIAMKPMGAADEEGGYIFKLKPSDQNFEALKKKGLSLGKLTIKYLLQSDVIATALPAMNSVEEVLENVQASGDGPLNEDEEKFLQIYQEEGGRSFPQILPENDYWITPWMM